MAEQYRYRLTTTDNPFDPFDQFDSWLNYDMLHGYNTLGALAEAARTSDELGDRLNQLYEEEAITDVILNDPLNLYVRVRKAV